MRQQTAFTLIELMVVVAIVGILAGIAYPSYQESVMKSRRSDAKGVLLSLANTMERHFTEVNSYCDAAAGGTAVANCASAVEDTGSPSIFAIPADTASYYAVTISAAAPNSYTLSAAPTGVQSGDKCGTLTLTHTGVKNNSAGLSLTECW